MPSGAFYREYLEKLVPDAFRRRRGDKVRLCPDMLRGCLFDVETEGRGKPHCPEQTERVLIQHPGLRDANKLCPTSSLPSNRSIRPSMDFSPMNRRRSRAMAFTVKFRLDKSAFRSGPSKLVKSNWMTSPASFFPHARDLSLFVEKEKAPVDLVGKGSRCNLRNRMASGGRCL